VHPPPPLSLPRPKQPSIARPRPRLTPRPHPSAALPSRAPLKLTGRPHPSAAPPLSLSRRSSAGSLGPPVRPLVPPMTSPASSPPTTVRLVSSPLTRSPSRLAPCAPAHRARTVPSPPPARAVPSPVCAITTIMASSSALAPPPPVPPPQAHIKRTARAPPFPHQPRLPPLPRARLSQRRRRPSPLR
jgi:neural Wiskott-Aldrich syndrome protein